MKQNITAYLVGVAFALGLGISQMTRPPKILGFLNVLGPWDPTLLVVFMCALGVYLLFYLFVIPKETKNQLTVFLKQQELPPLRLILGSILFGIGWGLCGLCPGPAITDLVSGKPVIFLFVIAMLLGMLSVKFLAPKKE